MPQPLFDQDRLATALEEAGVEAIVAARGPNVLYFTRYRKGGRALALVPGADPGRPTLLVPAADIDFLLEDLADGVEARAYGTFHRFVAEGVELEPREAVVADLARATRTEVDGPALAAEELVAAGLGKAFIATDDLRLGAALDGRLPEAHVAYKPDLVADVRAVKTPEEVHRLAEAARIAEQGIRATLARAAPGVTQADLARAFCASVAEASARVRLDNVSIGRGTALGNVNEPRDVVTEGSIIRFDVGVIHDGYASDLSRCFVYGRAEERATRLYDALLAGQEAALAALRPGAVASNLFGVAVEAVRAAGLPRYERTNVGHGIGLAGDGYDKPMLAPGDGTEIEEGMVLCVETPYYELGFGGLQVEDMVVVTTGGYEALTHLPRGLEVLG